MKKVCICGHFGGNQNFLDGQTIKTKIIASALKDRFTPNEIAIIDTFGGIKNIISIIVRLIIAFIRCKNIIILPEKNGIKLFAPACAILKKIFKRRVHYTAIGGWLRADYCVENPRIKKHLLKFDYIYVEMASMKTSLESNGFNNVLVMPNCKELNIVGENEITRTDSPPYKLCTFSRVLREKGIECAIDAVKKVNEEQESIVYKLDIYGQIDQEYEKEFAAIQAEMPAYIKYCGCVPFDKSTDIIKEYFALLFPTYYESEGFAGTIIDAFAAGVPVVASDWKYNAEIIDEEVGYIFKAKNTQELASILSQMKDNPDAVNTKKIACVCRAREYTSQVVVEILCERLA